MTNTTAPREQTDWRIIAYYVFAFAAGGVVKPFLNLYLTEIGLSGSQIGVLYGWAALAAVAIAPSIGFLADRTQRHRLILGIVTSIKGFTPPLILLSSAWWWLVATVSTRVVTAGVSDGLFSPLTVKYLKTRGDRNIGRVRIWGALSFAGTSLLAGWLAGDGSVSVLFPLAGLLGVLAALFVAAFPSQITEHQSDARHKLLTIKPARTMLLLYFLSFLYAFSTSGPEVFTNVYLVKKLGAANQLIGVIGAVFQLAPLAGYYIADSLIDSHGGAGSMAISFLLLGISWAGYAFINIPSLAIPFVICQGMGQAIYMISLIIMITSIGRASRASTELLMVLMTIPGLARIVAQPVSGLIYDTLGGRILFNLDAALIMASAILLWINHQRLSMAVVGDGD
jgi:PPP family 3-phenylpropionic acid transporter